MIRNHLPQDWTLTPVALGEGAPGKLQGLTIPATVPGCVHTDLLAAGAIADPYADGGEAAQAWIGHSDWLYRCAFTAPADLLDSACIDLVCEGLDTVARIELNGKLVAETEDMHVAYRFPVKALLRPGENDLAITFTSPIRYAREMLERLGHLNYSFPHNPPHNFIRKAACQFGWDWGPSLPGAGIWRPIRLEGWNTARIEAVRPLVRRADTEQAEVEVLVETATAVGAPVATINVRLFAPDGAVVAEGTTGTAGRPQPVVLTVSKPQLWWPAGHGEQPLYTLEAILADSAGRTLDTWRKRTGLKTSRIVSEKDTYGQSFALEVNARLIFAKGYDWIPDDCFPSRVDAARYRRRILQAREGGANILRVWGGGLFETDEFYDACDELGLMVWQDFLFACSAYPEEPPFAALIEQEARTNLARLARHPSLVILNGGNENIWIQYHPHHVKGEGGGRGWGLNYYLDLLPKVCAELLPTVPYWPNSPWSGSLDIHPYEDSFGNNHQWLRWTGGILYFERYRLFRPRFVAEFGHQAPPTYATLKEFLPADQLQPDSRAMRDRQKVGPDGNEERLNAPLREVFADPDNFDDWHYLTQLAQARSVSGAVEYYRSLQPYCMGAICWQLNDCWPVTSWAAVDGCERRKPLWFALRRAFAPRLLSIRNETGDTLFVFGNNDTAETWHGTLHLRRMNFAGEVVAETTARFTLAPWTGGRLAPIPIKTSYTTNQKEQFLLADAGGVRAFHYYKPDKELVYPKPSFDTQLKPLDSGEGYSLHLTAKSFLRDFAVFADRIAPDAEVSDQLITLLPGEQTSTDIRTKATITVAQMLQKEVIRCANSFGEKP